MYKLQCMYALMLFLWLRRRTLVCAKVDEKLHCRTRVESYFLLFLHSTIFIWHLKVLKSISLLATAHKIYNHRKNVYLFFVFFKNWSSRYVCFLHSQFTLISPPNICLIFFVCEWVCYCCSDITRTNISWKSEYNLTAFMDIFLRTKINFVLFSACSLWLWIFIISTGKLNGTIFDLNLSKK